jgi:D-glycero-D-manno-heptose 1,7-bisphosphate phosphatase
VTNVVFLDRDGVLNADIGYLWRKEDFIWIPGAPEAVRLFNQRGWQVVVVTNQSGVARGYYEESDVQLLHDWMNEELAKHDAHIDRFYFCPHYPQGTQAKYAVECDCRKPQPGMILRGLAEWRGNPSTSFLIGDKESDIAAATAAGIAGYLFTGANLLDFVRQNIINIEEKK